MEEDTADDRRSVFQFCNGGEIGDAGMVFSKRPSCAREGADGARAVRE